MPFFLSKNTDFLTNLVIRTSFFLLAILVCLTCAKPTDTDDSNIDPRDSNSAAPSPFIVADDDLGSAWNDLTNLPGAVYRGITSPEPVPQNPTEPDPKPTPPPEDSPAPIPQPECREYTSEFIAVCCVDPPISLAHNPTEDTILYNFFFLTRCSQSNPPMFFLLQISVESCLEISIVIEKQTSIFCENSLLTHVIYRWLAEPPWSVWKPLVDILLH